MNKIISETEVIAYDYLKAFGFEDEQIAPLIVQAKKDLIKTLSQLDTALHAEAVSLEDINDGLHALKGLLFHLGNHELAEKLNEIRSHLDSEAAIKEVSQVLFD